IQPVPDLREDFTGTIMTREDLDYEIRSEFEEGARDGLRQALSTDERDIGSAHRVGIPCQRKPGIPDEHRSRAGQIGVGPEPRAEVGGDVAVLAAGRLMHDQPAAHQLRPLVRHVGVQQIFGRHEWRTHIWNVGSALGHWQARSRVGINERSTYPRYLGIEATCREARGRSVQELGVMIVLLPYDDAWPLAFESEA